MSELFFYDDAIARDFEPFALTRPICELRAGALLVRERWQRSLGSSVAGIVTSQHLADFDEPWADVKVLGGRDVIPKGAVLANSRCAVALAPIANADVWRCDGRVAAVRLDRDLDVEELSSGQLALEKLAPGSARRSARSVDVQGRWMEHVWDYLAHVSAMLREDIPVLAVSATRSGHMVGMVKGGGDDGGANVFAEDGATVEPQVLFDTTDGPVLIRKGATVQAFTRIVGPCFIGAESLVGGDKISGSSIGETCKVHGELSATILVGHSNKSHDGFVGHSYLGRWVNLGAGTITSNLKNTYGPVQLWTPQGTRDTGLQFLGALFGDHCKTGIGTLLNTGTIVGAGANVYGGTLTPKVIPPFAWGEQPPYATYRMEKFVEAARRAMSRRHVELGAREVRLLTAAFEQRWRVEGDDGPAVRTDDHGGSAPDRTPRRTAATKRAKR